MGIGADGMNQMLIDRQAVIADGGACQVLGLQVSTTGVDQEAVFVLHVGIADVKHSLSLRGNREQRPQVHFPAAQRRFRTRLQYPLQADSVAPRRVPHQFDGKPGGPAIRAPFLKRRIHLPSDAIDPVVDLPQAVGGDAVRGYGKEEDGHHNPAGGLEAFRSHPRFTIHDILSWIDGLRC